MSNQKKKQQGQLWNLVFNIILPVVILNNLSKYIEKNGAIIALIVALSLPIGYFIKEYIDTKEKNIFSILGFVNILFTGGLALMQLEGFWFAVKEAAFPLVIGVAVLYSAFTSRPLIRMLIYNPDLIDVDKITEKLQERNKEAEFADLLKRSTIYLSGSFLVSAILNYVLAMMIFTEIPIDLPEEVRMNILNGQISKMTWMGYVVILVPSMILLSGILYHLFKGIESNTGLKFKDIVKAE